MRLNKNFNPTKNKQNVSKNENDKVLLEIQFVNEKIHLFFYPAFSSTLKLNQGYTTQITLRAKFLFRGTALIEGHIPSFRGQYVVHTCPKQ